MDVNTPAKKATNGCVVQLDATNPMPVSAPENTARPMYDPTTAPAYKAPSADGLDDPDRRDDLEAAALYDLIETQVAPRFYDVDAGRILLDGQPLSLIRHRFCASLAPLLADYQGGSLRQYLAERDLPLVRTFSLIGARLPSREEAAHLLMPRHAPLLSVLTLSRDPSGRAVELAQSSSRADRFQYQVAT